MTGTLMRIMVFSGLCLVLVACSAAPFGGDEETDERGTGSSGSGGLGLSGSSGAGGNQVTPPPCPGDHASIDEDGDGFTGAQGDCNDCTDLMNPAARDYPGNGVDEDCNGAADDDSKSCDGELGIDSTDAMDAARAMGLCKKQVGASWGVKSAAYVTSDGAPLAEPLGHGILPGFGSAIHAQEGSKILALSSGSARQPSDPGYQDVGGYDKGYTSGAPPGYPKESPACPGVATGEPHDSAGLQLVIQTPSNAKSMKLKLNFYTYEFPDYICSKFNDFFVAMLDPVPNGQPDGNISFDGQGNTISVNAGFLEVCAPQMAGGKMFACPTGADELSGTGFEGHAATGWLQTSTKVTDPGGTVTLQLAVWDSGDGWLDSTVLLDAFTFDLAETPTVTEPVPEPK